MKKIDIYLIKHFFVILIMTFFICIFVLLMQFLWLHVKDLIGKGIGWAVLAEFFLYASLTLVPLALPLAVLLASLMTFGNLGERFELTAMKAAGISLFRIMRSVMFFSVFTCLFAFYFSNTILPIAQTKLWALIFSLRQKSPELDIPTGEFYNGINNMNLYVRSKSNGMLKNLMIYDFEDGFQKARIATADSGKVELTADKKHLLLTLYSGESFENLDEQKKRMSESGIPYRRESFDVKEILIDFDTDFNRYDESLLRNQHVSKNAQQLLQSIDSTYNVLDAKLRMQGSQTIEKIGLGMKPYEGYVLDTLVSEKTKVPHSGGADINNLYQKLSQADLEFVATRAIEKAKDKNDEVRYSIMLMNDSIVYVRRHLVELHRKFTLSFACLIFFFIGAPLGAIIRKGGLGVPVVISVVLFIFYYIVDNSGYKMAREGIWEVYQGMWISSVIFLPLGVFLTYKAVIDASIYTPDSYKKIFDKTKNFITTFFKKKAKAS